MKGPPLNKNSLLKEQKQLKIYRDFLPSLELKRRQLMGQKNNAALHLSGLREQVEKKRSFLFEQLPMMADESVVLSSFVKVKSLVVEQENIVGVWLPKLVELSFSTAEYAVWGTPHWLESAFEALCAVSRVVMEVRIQERRLLLLQEALRKTTQRVNLFEQVLIPRAEADIKRIRLFLSEMEREGVIRAKIAKAKRMR